METQDVNNIAHCKQRRGARIAHNWWLLACIVIGAGVIGLLAAAWT
tara:strand:- start:3027 stop:3164 length:138 start_codon:yes stop_codon:yes gene_type:complete